MRPTIGITQCLDDRGRWREGRDYLYLDHAYSVAIERAGGRPLQLPMQQDALGLAEKIDGLLVPGGDDFAPPHAYPSQVRFDPAPAAQIDFDRRVLAAAISHGLPVLGICYGAQLMSLHHGGRLYYDLQTDLAQSAPHQLPEAHGRHPIRVDPGTHLASILEHTELVVNSLHHQAIAEPGGQMVASAHSPDGVIEAIETSGGQFEIGVQWHPEKLDDPAASRLFASLVDACAER